MRDYCFDNIFTDHDKPIFKRLIYCDSCDHRINNKDDKVALLTFFFVFVTFYFTFSIIQNVTTEAAHRILQANF